MFYGIYYRTQIKRPDLSDYNVTYLNFIIGFPVMIYTLIKDEE